nr:helix-turn-helix transcriptional regulator [uncultured Cardiobacterium sp.]
MLTFPITTCNDEDAMTPEQLKALAHAAQEERLPHEMVKRLCEENPLRVWREYRGFSGRKLAAAAGISSAYLSDIENGNKDGSISVLKRIAEILRVDVDDII